MRIPSKLLDDIIMLASSTFRHCQILECLCVAIDSSFHIAVHAPDDFMLLYVFGMHQWHVEPQPVCQLISVLRGVDTPMYSVLGHNLSDGIKVGVHLAGTVSPIDVACHLIEENDEAQCVFVRLGGVGLGAFLEHSLGTLFSLLCRLSWE